MTELIVALDVDGYQNAFEVVHLCKGCRWFKVGMQLYTRVGPDIIGMIKEARANIMLDLKYYDIPNTVASAVVEANRLEVDMLTLHASGGPRMIEAARKATVDAKLLAVTVLTSFDHPTWRTVVGPGEEEIQETVARMALMAWNSGAHGVVCSPEETSLVRATLPEEAIVVNPGIRPEWSLSRGDQVRVTTPRTASDLGASFIVVGRPVLGHEDKEEAVTLINKELMG